ncbi:hypothetical protein B0H19DRAFT_1225921 [Mycena capillaripes]|nr:hypothetical protein B0H19DRAFT_1225921 [Mycena capillaripes]
MPWTLCGLFQFPPDFSFRRGRANPDMNDQGLSGQESDPSNSAESTEQNPLAGDTGLIGRTGGKGDSGSHTGGEGDLEKATQLAMDHVDRFREIHGDTGVQGGPGDVIGGSGGTGQGPTFSHQLLSIDGKNLPPLSVAEFCQEYNLSDKIHKLLDEQGFETVGAFFKLTDTDLKDAGFKIGHIAELRRALDDFASKGGAVK